ncbi:MAG: hypothetical protein Q9184_000477 [Pyrenodesmia sp. 2 TL-2023]
MSEKISSTAPSAAEPSVSIRDAGLNHEAPDPQEDDLDDLDELLDDFTSPKNTTDQQYGPPQETLYDNSQGDAKSSPAVTDDFNKQLQEQMAALMSDGDESPEMQTEIQTMLQELSAAVDSRSAQDQSDLKESQPNLPAATEGSFDDAIQRTLQRMQASGDEANAAAAADQEPGDILAQMLEEMQRQGAGDATGEEEFSRMLMTMMEQLTNKDILYDPMKELNDKFPSWMLKNREVVQAPDLPRYEEQQRLIAEIVGKFEESTYSDLNAKDRAYIIERMQEVVDLIEPFLSPTLTVVFQMQAAGSPPADLVGDMSGAQDALQDLNAACPQQ